MPYAIYSVCYSFLLIFTFRVLLKMEDNKVIFNHKAQITFARLFDLFPSIFIDQTNIFVWLLKNLLFNSIWQQHWEKFCSQWYRVAIFGILPNVYWGCWQEVHAKTFLYIFSLLLLIIYALEGKVLRVRNLFSKMMQFCYIIKIS